MPPLYPNTPLALGALHETLRADTIDLSYEWQLWKGLFRTSQAQIELLNSSSPVFFARIQATLFQSVVLRVGRLLDNPQTSGQDNLVLEQLLLASPTDIPAALAIEMRASLDKAKALAGAVKKWRHKYLAHRDLAHASLATPPADTEIKYDDIDDIIQAFGDYLNSFDQYFEKRDSVYLVAGELGHERLVRRLNDAALWHTLPTTLRYSMREGA